MYKNMQEITQDLKQWDSHCCSVSNFVGLCKIIKQALIDDDLATSSDEMHRLTHLYKYATSIEEYKWSKDEIKPKEVIINDFKVASAEIEEYFCKYFVTGDFEITEEILNRHYDMVDWDAFHNKNGRNFINACKKANQIVGYTGDDESSEYYTEDKDRWNFVEIFCSHYNGGRLIASFKNLDDALMWSYHHDAHQEEDGLYWAEQPCY